MSLAQLNEPPRKAALAHVLVLGALEAERADVEAAGWGPYLDILVIGATYQAVQALDHPDASESCETFLANLPGRLERAWPTPAEAPAQVQGLHSSVAQRVAEYLQTSEDPLERIFQLVRADVETYYRQHLVDPTAITPNVELAVRWQDGPVGGGASPAPGVTGSTIPIEGGARVTVLLAPRHLDWASWMTVPYLLFHELLVHAYARPPANSDLSAHGIDRFAEGWMDSIALRVHDSLMWSRQPHGPAACRAAGVFHSARFAGGADPIETGARLQGRQCAERLLSVLTRLTPDPEAVLLRLSAGLNTCRLTSLEREEMASILHACLNPARRSDLVPLLGPMRDCIAALASAGDHLDLWAAAESFADVVNEQESLFS
jgi:hypothetical protein